MLSTYRGILTSRLGFVADDRLLPGGRITFPEEEDEDEEGAGGAEDFERLILADEIEVALTLLSAQLLLPHEPPAGTKMELALGAVRGVPSSTRVNDAVCFAMATRGAEELLERKL